MKKVSLVLAAGLMAFASCNNEAAEGTMTQAQFDSAVNAEVGAAQMQMMAEQDMIIEQMAQAKADSMMAVAKGQTPAPIVVPTRRPTTRPTAPKPTTPTTTTPTNTGKNNGDAGNNGGKRGAEGTDDGVNKGKR